MLGHGDRDALRTERFVDELMAADRRDDARGRQPRRGGEAGRVDGAARLDRAGRVDGAAEPATPADADLDPAVLLAARALRADLTRVHPSFRFEEALAERLAIAAAAAAEPGTLTAFPAEIAATIADRDTAGNGGPWRAILPAVAFRRIPEVASRPSRPLIVGGVGVASAISIGAVYVAWRHARPSSGRMGRAVRAAHDRTAGSGRNRRSGSAHGIFGVLS